MDSPTTELRLDRWDRPLDDGDQALLEHCAGPTLDVGCGPGRLTVGLAERGHITLGIDVVGVAVGQTRERGALALQRDVFDAVPGEGRWWTALLADGNLGIGGDPVALLRRLRELLDPRGRIVTELAPPGTPRSDDWAMLHLANGGHRLFRWSVVGLDEVETIAAEAGLDVAARSEHAGRWWAVLEERR